MHDMHHIGKNMYINIYILYSTCYISCVCACVWFSTYLCHREPTNRCNKIEWRSSAGALDRFACELLDLVSNWLICKSERTHYIFGLICSMRSNALPMRMSKKNRCFSCEIVSFSILILGRCKKCVWFDNN